MLLANNKCGELIEPTRNEDAYCPYCESNLRAKCGTIVTHHWAHISKDDNCIYKPETEWHRRLKKEAYRRGAKIEVRYGHHIADIVFRDIQVIELQHSNISQDEIISRSKHHTKRGRVIDWVFDYKDKYDDDQLIFTQADDWMNFKQKWQKKTLQALFNSNGVRKYWHVYLDFGLLPYIFQVEKLYENGNGWGNQVKNKPFKMNLRRDLGVW